MRWCDVEFFKKSYLLKSEYGDENGALLTLHNLGLVYLKTDIEKAKETLESVLEKSRALKNVNQTVLALSGLTKAYIRLYLQ